MPSEKEKMLAGEIYNASDPQLVNERNHARSLLRLLNISEFGEPSMYRSIFSLLLPNCSNDIWIEPPFYCDYGSNVYAGKNVFLNFNCVILDVCPVKIGDYSIFGPGVHIYAASHPKDFLERRIDVEFGEPVTIGEDCWIGGGAIILPGISIGNRCIVGAGAVVTKDLPDDTVFVGKK